MNRTVSESRTYVAMCNGGNSDRYYFRKFVLPEGLENDSARASHYFLKQLDAMACIDGCMAWESYSNIHTLPDSWHARAVADLQSQGVARHLCAMLGALLEETEKEFGEALPDPDVITIGASVRWSNTDGRYVLLTVDRDAGLAIAKGGSQHSADYRLCTSPAQLAAALREIFPKEGTE